MIWRCGIFIGIIGFFKKNLLFATKNGTSVCNRLSYPDRPKDSVTSMYKYLEATGDQKKKREKSYNVTAGLSAFL